jgi:hypothetical protein
MEWQSLGDEKRGTEVDPAGSRPVNRVGRDLARALESALRSGAVGAQHAVGEEAALKGGRTTMGVMH